MANICDTRIHFKGEQTALDDLFSKLKTESLRDVAVKFGITQADIPYDMGFTRGDIIDIDEKCYEITQNDAWYPRTSIWQAIINKYYKDELSFVYKAEEPGSDIYINTDTTRTYFTESFMCDYCVDNEDDTICFDDEQSLLDWANEKFNATAVTVDELRAYMDDYIGDDEYCTIGEYEHEYN